MAKDHPTGKSGLYQAFLQLKTPEQCYRFLQDVCSYSELSAMEQRYNIAEMLVDKRIYTEIMDRPARPAPSSAGSAGFWVPMTASCAPCWRPKSLPSRRPEPSRKLCRVPPVRYAAFSFNREDRSPRVSGALWPLSHIRRFD